MSTISDPETERKKIKEILENYGMKMNEEIKHKKAVSYVNE